MDVLAGAQIHYRVGAPFGGPTHFFHFFLNRGRHSAVANVSIDLYQEIAADDHRLGLGMIDICRNDGAAARDFLPNKFWSDLARD